MHLIYLDETGNTGNNLNDPQQPVFLLCAMLIHKDRWQGLEAALQQLCARQFGGRAEDDGFEIHAADLRNGNGPFRGMQVSDRVRFRDAWIQAAVDADVKLIYRPIEKMRYRK